MESIYEEIGGTYRKEGDFLIPDLALPDTSEYQIGKYGRMCQRYLKEHRNTLYTSMMLSGELYPYLAEVDQTCNERMERLVHQMAKREGVTEAMKAADQLGWVGHMNNIRSRAEEIVFREVIYA